MPAGRWPGADRAPERAIVFGFAVVSLLGALATAPFVDTSGELSPLWLLGAVALVAAVHAVTILGVRPALPAPAGPPAESGAVQSVAPPPTAAGPGRGSLVFACFCSAVAALALALIALIIAIRTTSIPLLVTAPLLVALTLALGLEFLSNRTAGARRTAERVAALTAALAAGYFALATASNAAWPLGVALVRGLTVFASDPGTTVNPLLPWIDGLDNPVGPNSLWALCALVAAGALTAVIWRAGRLLRVRASLVAALFAATLVLAVPFAAPVAGLLWLVPVLFALLGAGALLALFGHQRGRLPLGPLRSIVLALVIVSVSLGFLVGWARSDTWWIGTAAGILALVVARGLLGTVPDDHDARGGRAQGRGALLAGALLLTLLAAVVAPWALTLGARPPATVLIVDQLRGLTLATALLQLFFAVPLPRWVQPTERRWAFRTLLAPTILAFCPARREPRRGPRPRRSRRPAAARAGRGHHPHCGTAGSRRALARPPRQPRRRARRAPHRARRARPGAVPAVRRSAPGGGCPRHRRRHRRAGRRHPLLRPRAHARFARAPHAARDGVPGPLRSARPRGRRTPRARPGNNRRGIHGPPARLGRAAPRRPRRAPGSDRSRRALRLALPAAPPRLGRPLPRNRGPLARPLPVGHRSP
ncbi:hypothetical protein KIV56_11885 [Cryobacterium breve]|uniref:Uncharacterized protein n=1 Tax=Cryobacterium breve TaxID=1259258 RepID=A0ABY7N9K4_9MICO|nr:hypothetical protein [Cryobacterium breve]WBM79171.1 hypothetical protein KIV56_11885 [Cryobacterium breve]